MSRILLLVSQPENRRLLSKWLTLSYQVVLPDSLERLEGVSLEDVSFDLGIVDGRALEQYGPWIVARKEAEKPAILPFILITSSPHLGIAKKYLWQTVDDLIRIPIKKIELQARVEVLLRSRQLSVDLNSSHHELKNALNQVRELSDLKTSLLHIVSHDIRNPLTVILGVSRLLTDHQAKLTLSKQGELINRLKESIQNIVRLLDDVLIFSRSESEKLSFQPQPIDLSSFCKQLIEELNNSLIFQNNSYLVKLNFKINNPYKLVSLDERLLRPILTNLLSNAIKYTTTNSEVNFEIDVISETAIFSIQDRGIGIPIDDREQLFNFFFRAKNVGGIYGTGLGLSIVKKCVDLHGGSIEVESKVGIGSKFTVILPVIAHVEKLENEEYLPQKKSN